MDDEQVCTAPDVPTVAVMINCCSFTKFMLIRNSLSTTHWCTSLGRLRLKGALDYTYWWKL